jgi:hypothetical protein
METEVVQNGSGRKHRQAVPGRAVAPVGGAAAHLCIEENFLAIARIVLGACKIGIVNTVFKNNSFCRIGCSVGMSYRETLQLPQHNALGNRHIDVDAPPRSSES